MTTDSELELLRATIQGMQARYLADLERLVNIDCGSYNKTGVDEVGRWVAAQFEELGAEVSVEPNQELGDTIVARFAGSGGKNALLVGHMDTVFPDGTVSERPFEIRNGRAYGPGVDDMKGGLLAGIYALRALRGLRSGGAGKTAPADWLPFGRLTFVANPDEEIGSPQSTAVIKRESAGADLALVLESARENGDVVSARKGIADFHIQLAGRAAHAGVEPEKGRSATVEAAHKTLALTALNGRWPGVTVNVGVIRGGTRPNVVAESASMEVDVRATSRQDMEAVEAAIREIAERSTVAEVSATVARRAQWWPMERSAQTAALAELAIELARRIGFSLRDASTGGASDANTTSGMGVATLDGLGPVGGADHAPGEYLELDSIVQRVQLLAALLLSAAEM